MKAAIYYLERISGLSEYLRISVKPNTSNAVKFGKSANSPTATCQWNQFEGQGGVKLGASIVQGTFQHATATSCDSLDMTVEDYMLKNPATTRLFLIHVSAHQNGMDQTYDGRTCVEHINSVLELGAKLRMKLAILQEPSVNPATKTAMNAVFDGFKHGVGQYDEERATVINGGMNHTGWSDPAFGAWINVASTRSLVVIGCDADICVRANVFGSTEFVDSTSPLGTVTPPRLVPALLERKDIVTSRPMLIAAGKVQQAEWDLLQHT